VVYPRKQESRHKKKQGQDCFFRFHFLPCNVTFLHLYLILENENVKGFYHGIFSFMISNEQERHLDLLPYFHLQNHLNFQLHPTEPAVLSLLEHCATDK
jgi:hypothetical protein